VERSAGMRNKMVGGVIYSCLPFTIQLQCYSYFAVTLLFAYPFLRVSDTVG
jgi:hypothetical protein